MTVFDVLLVVFISLKIVGVIKFSWWLVFTPTYIELLLYILASWLKSYKHKEPDSQPWDLNQK